MNKWSHLPNARHIDRVLESVKSHPRAWGAAYDADWNTAWDEGRVAARTAIRNLGRSAACSAYDLAQMAACAQGPSEAPGEAYTATWTTSRLALAALIAWDDCGQYLDMTSKELELWITLSQRQECIMLLPAVKAFERIAEQVDA